ncbi:hypothetical protein Ddye_027490 [Dipteronia dyeriana]|uniref:Reverse transcriptase n=1 Tax=Dipteronia dyeriana TaxID=168575 RepID=A0AAD9TP73_9ROSI|nr:hypothetical protein Ddye_027490 [Dipteronia dyeriana]
MRQLGLPRTLSDHNAILVGKKWEDWGPKPFHFFNGWLEDKGLMEETVKGWNGCKSAGSKGFSLASKAKEAKKSMRCWIAVKKRVVGEGKFIENILAELDSKAEVDGWTDCLRKERMDCLAKLWKELRKEEQLWRQKSRVNWLKEGDKNSKFFHSMKNGRRMRNYFNDISFGSGKISDPVLIKEGVVDFFKNYYTKVKWNHPSIIGLNFMGLKDSEREALKVGFSEEEVWAVVCSCDGNQTPGPDDLNLDFVKANWNAIQVDLMNFIHEFHRNGESVKDLNKTFVALIPKRTHPETMKDFRPISLVNSMYKILAKVLANRLKLVMGCLISES